MGAGASRLYGVSAQPVQRVGGAERRPERSPELPGGENPDSDIADVDSIELEEALLESVGYPLPDSAKAVVGVYGLAANIFGYADESAGARVQNFLKAQEPALAEARADVESAQAEMDSGAVGAARQHLHRLNENVQSQAQRLAFRPPEGVDEALWRDNLEEARGTTRLWHVPEGGAPYGISKVEARTQVREDMRTLSACFNPQARTLDLSAHPQLAARMIPQAWQHLDDALHALHGVRIEHIDAPRVLEPEDMRRMMRGWEGLRELRELQVRPPFGWPDVFTIDASRLSQLTGLYVHLDHPSGELLVSAQAQVRVVATGPDVSLAGAWVRDAAQSSVEELPGEGAGDLPLGRDAPPPFEAAEAPPPLEAAEAQQVEPAATVAPRYSPLAAAWSGDLLIDAAQRQVLERAFKRCMVRNAEGGYDLPLDKVPQLRGLPVSSLWEDVWEQLQQWSLQGGSVGITRIGLHENMFGTGGPWIARVSRPGNRQLQGLHSLTSLRRVDLEIPPGTNFGQRYAFQGLARGCLIDIRGERSDRDNWKVQIPAGARLSISGVPRDPMGYWFHDATGQVFPEIDDIRDGSVNHGLMATYTRRPIGLDSDEVASRFHRMRAGDRTALVLDPSDDTLLQLAATLFKRGQVGAAALVPSAHEGFGDIDALRYVHNLWELALTDAQLAQLRDAWAQAEVGPNARLVLESFFAGAPG